MELVLFAAVACIVGYIVWFKIRGKKEDGPSGVEVISAYRNECLLDGGTWTEIKSDLEYHCTDTTSNSDFKIVRSSIRANWDQVDL